MRFTGVTVLLAVRGTMLKFITETKSIIVSLSFSTGTLTIVWVDLLIGDERRTRKLDANECEDFVRACLKGLMPERGD